MIAFATGDHRWQFDRMLHPAVRAVVVELDRFCDKRGYASVLVTGVSRDEAKMAEIYGADWKERGKFSWHLANRAVDIRSRDWTKEQCIAIEGWLKTHWPDAEVLIHDVWGKHLHLAIPGPRSRYRRLKRWITARSKR